MATEELKALEAQGLTELTACADETAVQAWFDKFLGERGLWKAAFGKMGAVPKDQKAAFGAESNRVKAALTAAYEKARSEAKERALEASLTTNPLDMTVPGRERSRGRLHPLTQARRQVCAILAEFGFQTCRAHGTGAEEVVASTLRESGGKPVRALLVGSSFEQITGLVAGAGPTMADLKGTIDAFTRRMFGARPVRIRGGYSPFTEPSIAVDVECAKTEIGWLELIVGGMLSPTVLRAGGYDPEKATGFAFVVALDRVLTLAHGLDDVRLLRQNDLRFLEQF